jgi:hypothetical protein
MSTVASPHPVRKPRERRPLAPVTGTCRWLVQPGAGPCPHPGCLSITCRRPSDGSEVTETYLVAENRDGVALAGYRLTKPDGTAYDLPADFSACDCPDAVYAAERPGGCKHRKALAKALADLAATAA